MALKQEMQAGLFISPDVNAGNVPLQQAMSGEICQVHRKTTLDTTPTTKATAGAQYHELSSRPRSRSWPRRFFDFTMKRIAHSQAPTRTAPAKRDHPSPGIKEP